MTPEERAGASGLKCQVCGDPLCRCECIWNLSAERPDYSHDWDCKSVELRGAPVKPRIIAAYRGQCMSGEGGAAMTDDDHAVCADCLLEDGGCALHRKPMPDHEAAVERITAAWAQFVNVAAAQVGYVYGEDYDALIEAGEALLRQAEEQERIAAGLAAALRQGGSEREPGEGWHRFTCMRNPCSYVCESQREALRAWEARADG